MTLEDLWQSTLADMEVQLSRANFSTWLKQSRLVDKQDGTFYVALPNNFAKEWVENKYQKNLLGIIRNFDNSARKLEFIVAPQHLEAGSPIHPAAAQPSHASSSMSLELKTDPETNLNPRYTLSSFVVGPSNELAFAAASAVVGEVGTKYNPFFVYGGVGLGKTHLIQAVGNEVVKKSGGRIRPKYVPSERFTSDVVWAIRNKRMEDIKRKYRDVDLLIIDDIQFIGGKEKTEEEFFHTFNALYEHNKQIIISSDRPPQSIPTLEERLRSRFEGGLIADINYPEYEMRVAIIKSKLEEIGQALPNGVIEIIAKRVKKNIRELEGILNKILFHQERKHISITEAAATEIIDKSIQSLSHRVSDTQILKAIAEFFTINIDDLISHNRRKEVVEPRQIAMFLLRDMLELSYPSIGDRLGRDHTTAIHACEKIGRDMNKSAALNQKILMIRDMIYKG